jgi:gluconolactonase
MKRILLLCVFALVSYGQPATVGSVVRQDPALDAIVPKDAKIERVLDSQRFLEGPVWMKKGGYFFASDLMANAILKWTPGSTPTNYRKPVFDGAFPDSVMIGTNGLALDPQGRLIAAEHGNRRISRTEKNGTITTLADRYEGKRLNSPNDVVVKRNGDIYFTDPPGLYRTYPTGTTPPLRELDFAGVYRIRKGKLELLDKDVQYPNGIAFSPDEKKLYVSSSRPDKYWMVYDVTPTGGIANGHQFYDATRVPGENVPDGMKVDRAGNIYATGPAGLSIFSPEGKQLGVLQLPELPSNCAWGDADAKTLYITARTSIYRIRLNIAGLRR